jgi:peptidoglycan/xylan/chitin deacetylase (PgdA/CDA1 family)
MPLTPPTAWITTSWDDGNPLDMRLAEMLHRYGLKATFYIPRAIPSGVMGESQVRELSQSFEIGGHTLDHLFLPTIPDEAAQVQIAGCKKWVEDTTGRACEMFCPPAGKFNENHRAMIVDAGFVAFRSVELLSTARPAPRGGLLEMPTSLQSYPHARSTYVKNALKRKSWGSLVRYVVQGFSGDWERHAERLLRGVIRRGGVFHLWGHSWEIEQTGQWGAVERVLRVMGEFAKEARAATNGEVCRAVG